MKRRKFLKYLGIGTAVAAVPASLAAAQTRLQLNTSPRLAMSDYDHIAGHNAALWDEINRHRTSALVKRGSGEWSNQYYQTQLHPDLVDAFKHLPEVVKVAS